MAYSDPADLTAIMPEREILELAVDDGQIDDIEDDEVVAVLAAVISEADREIDAYAGQVAAVPLAYVPPLIRHLSSRIARYRLHARRSHIETPKAVVRDYEDALRNLSRIASGAVALATGPDVETAPDPGGVLVSAPERLRFGDRTWRRFPRV
jgi:phage gp36-like protein